MAVTHAQACQALYDELSAEQQRGLAFVAALNSPDQAAPESGADYFARVVIGDTVTRATASYYQQMLAATLTVDLPALAVADKSVRDQVLPAMAQARERVEADRTAKVAAAEAVRG